MHMPYPNNSSGSRIIVQARGKKRKSSPISRFSPRHLQQPIGLCVCINVKSVNEIDYYLAMPILQQPGGSSNDPSAVAVELHLSLAGRLDQRQPQPRWLPLPTLSYIVLVPWATGHVFQRQPRVEMWLGCIDLPLKAIRHN